MLKWTDTEWRKTLEVYGSSLSESHKPDCTRSIGSQLLESFQYPGGTMPSRAAIWSTLTVCRMSIPQQVGTMKFEVCGSGPEVVKCCGKEVGEPNRAGTTLPSRNTFELDSCFNS